MKKDQYNYGDYFRPGQRARVEFLLSDGAVFKDWADVMKVEGDSLALRMSRDTLPEGTRTDGETPVMVRVGDNSGLSSTGYSCATVLVGAGGDGEVIVRCTQAVKPDDLREFFRLAAEIPVTLFNLTANDAENFKGEVPTVPGTPSRIVNISGGGIRTETTMATTDGDIVYATFHLPLPEPKAVPLVAQVVHSEEVLEGGERVYSTGLRYLHINERDRDSIVRFVCNEEIKRIRNTRKDFLSLP